MKKTYSLILSFVMVISMFFSTTPIQASTTTSGDGWLLQNGVLTVTKNIKRFIGYDWDKYSDEITKVVVKEGVTSLDYEQFSDFANLTSVSLPNTLKTISSSVFANDENLESITLPNNLKSVGREAFKNTGVKSVVLPGAIYSSEVFSYCVYLKNVTFKSGAEIGSSMFSDVQD